MVPPTSHKVSRVSWYFGYCSSLFVFPYGAFTLSGRLSQNLSARITESIMRSEPRCARTTVWPLSISLAATLEIDVSFSSSGYLDVSVHRVPFHTLWIGVWILEVYSSGFPHSEISGSKDICSSPKLIAAYHVFHRLLVPRHPPYALTCLTNTRIAQTLNQWSECLHSRALICGCIRWCITWNRRSLWMRCAISNSLCAIPAVCIALHTPWSRVFLGSSWFVFIG